MTHDRELLLRLRKESFERAVGLQRSVREGPIALDEMLGYCRPNLRPFMIAHVQRLQAELHAKMALHLLTLCLVDEELARLDL